MNAITSPDPFVSRLRRRLLAVLSPILQRWFRDHYAVERRWHRHGLDVIVKPGVFPPGPTISTSVLLDYLVERFRHRVPDGFRVLDMGCGTGLVGLLLARFGAWVLSTDINRGALANAALNTRRNGLTLHLACVDQLTALDAGRMDLIIITPPYYPKAPRDLTEHAWFCGPEFDYFRYLAPQLALLDLTRTEVVMVLSEDCDLGTIIDILAENGMTLVQLHAERRYLELTWILRVVRARPAQKFS